MATIYDRNVRLAWLLEISGVPVRYWAGQAPPAKSIGWGATDYVDIEAIDATRIGQQVDSLDELGGLGEMGAVSLSLASAGPLADTYDPRVILCRAGPKGAAWSSRLMETLPHALGALASVEVEDDPATCPMLGGQYVFHIGQECFRATGVAVGPYRFTGVNRAALGSRPQEHLTSARLGFSPLVYSDAVTWRTRRAVLKAAAITGAPLVDADYVEIIRGFLDRSPTLAADGLSVQLEIAPLTALVESATGSARSTGLAQGWHRFTEDRATTFAHTQMALFGDVVAEAVNVAAAAGDPFVQIHSYESWTLNSDVTLDDNHPRRLPLQPRTREWTDLPIGTTPPQQLDVTDPPGLGGAYGQGDGIYNASAWDVKTYTFPAGLYAWPNDILATLRQEWGPGTVSGAGGAWVDVVPQYPEGDGWPTIRCRANGGRMDKFVLEFRSDWSTGGRYGREFPGSGQNYNGWAPHEICHYGLQWCPPDGPWYDPRREGAMGETISRDAASKSRWVQTYDVKATKNWDVQDIFEIRGWPTAFFQTGELGFLAQDQIMSPAGTDQSVLVEWTEGGEEKQQITSVSQTFSVLSSGGDLAGYYYLLGTGWQRKTRSFGDWGEGKPAKITPVAAWVNKPAWEVILSLLQSGRGTGTNGSYDYVPFGLDIDEDDIDLPSFTLYGQGALARPWSPMLMPDQQIKDLINPLCQVLGCALVMRSVNGRQKIGLAPTGAPTDEVHATITSGDLAVDGRPESEMADECVIKYRVSANWDFIKDEPRITATYIDAPAMSEAGGDGGKQITLDLRGYEVVEGADLITEVLPLIESIRARVGCPRRSYSIVVSRGLGLSLSVGDVVRFSAPDAVGYSGSWGVSGILGRVTGRQVNHSGDVDSATLRITAYEWNTAGWAPAMRITNIIDADTVEVDSNYFSLATDPVTGSVRRDVLYFTGTSPPQPVDLIPPGNWAGRAAKNITGITNNFLTIVGHGASVGWTIRTRLYLGGGGPYDGYVHAADAAGTLGATSDPAKDWA